MDTRQLWALRKTTPYPFRPGFHVGWPFIESQILCFCFQGEPTNSEAWKPPVTLDSCLGNTTGKGKPFGSKIKWKTQIFPCNLSNQLQWRYFGDCCLSNGTYREKMGNNRDLCSGQFQHMPESPCREQNEDTVAVISPNVIHLSPCPEDFHCVWAWPSKLFTYFPLNQVTFWG